MPAETSTITHRKTLLTNAVSPNLFAATRFPELLISLLLANLLSPTLHDLTRYLNPQEHGGEMETLHRLLNKRFFHPLQTDFGRIWGLQEREGLHDPMDTEAFDYAVKLIRQTLSDHITVHPWLKVMVDLLDQGLFPRYSYPLVEMIRAQRSLIPGQGKKILGITSCLDECLLIAAIALSAGFCRMDGIVLAGSPVHYTLFIFPEDGDGCWFNAKRDLFQPDRFRGLSGDQLQKLFNSTIFSFDRIITPMGHCLLNSREATISHSDMVRVVEKIGGLMGHKPRQLLDAIEISADASASGYEGCGVLATTDARNSAELEKTLFSLAGEGAAVPEAALYSFRHHVVNDPEPYRMAALKGFRSYIWAGDIFSIDDALERAAAVQGNQSLLSSGSGRFALPDEVLAFNTASESERALLAYTLMQHSPMLKPSEKSGIELSFGNDKWELSCKGSRLM